MPYIEGRVVHDADAHIMETPNWLREHADPDIRDRVEPLQLSSGNELKQTGDPEEQLRDLDAAFEKLKAKHASEKYRASEEAEIMQRKNFAATGSFIAADRPRASISWVSPASSCSTPSTTGGCATGSTARTSTSHTASPAAHNRGMVEFCAVDDRLIPTLYVPLADLERAPEAAREALEMSDGACALLVASGCPKHHSPSHIALDAVWAQAQEAGVPIVFHVGGTGDLLDAAYFQNGLPIPPDFHGGEENFRSVDYMGIPHPPMQTLATLIFDGVLERFPDLRFGVIEQGAIWLPSWMRQMESAFEAFNRHEERLQKLSLKPSDYVYRQVRATPYPTEDVGWIIEQSGHDVCMFSSDFPHVEGGRKPLERFEASLGNASSDVRERFYRTNFEDLMGRALDRVPIPA